MRAAVLVLTVLAGIAAAQTPEAGGITPEWDVRSYMASLVADVQRMRSLVNRVDAPHWVSRGAPDAYLQQSKSAQESMEHLVAATEALSKQPEGLTAALEAFFQLERMELLITSLNNGVRKWQSEYTANEISQSLSANMVHRDRLRQHIRDLATARESEFRIMNEEAQRCRGTLTQAPPPPTPCRSVPKRSLPASRPR